MIADNLDGAEQALVRELGLGRSLAVVSDQNTYEVLGRRVERALGAGVTSVVLEQPQADELTAERLAERSRGAGALIAVGSGTLNDLCKHVGHRTGRPCIVFGTAPSMNGYTTSTVSISRDGYKHSLPAAAPVAVFLDLAILAAAPVRMIRAGLGDVLCRGTAQADWLLSHLLLDTSYAEDPFTIQAADERIVLERAGELPTGDPRAILALARLLVLGGLGMLMIGSSHPGSGGEHGISHYVDMFLKPAPRLSPWRAGRRGQPHHGAPAGRDSCARGGATGGAAGDRHASDATALRSRGRRLHRGDARKDPGC